MSRGGLTSLVLLVAALLASDAPAAPPWDVSPMDAEHAPPDGWCPAGDGVISAADSLVALRMTVRLITQLACVGIPLGPYTLDVAPCIPQMGNTCMVVGDGMVNAADALVILRAAVNLVFPFLPTDLFFASELASEPFVIYASDADLPPLGNFPGAEDIDEGNGIIDPRNVSLGAVIKTTGGSDPVSLCAYGVDPDLNPGAPPLACRDLAPFAAGEQRLESVTFPAPQTLGGVHYWLAVDTGDEVMETNEANNVVDGEFSITQPPLLKADLTFPSLGGGLAIFPRVPLSQEAVTIVTTIRNDGTLGVAVPFALDLFLDRSTPPDVGNCGQFFEVQGGIAAGAARNLNLPVTLPFLFPGLHQYYAVVDSGLEECAGPPDEIGDIDESDEHNNVSAPLDFCVASGVFGGGDKVDLRADGIKIQPEGAGLFSVIGQFSNAGTRDVLPYENGESQPDASFRINVTPTSGMASVLEAEFSCFPVGEQEFIPFGENFLFSEGPTEIRLRMDPGNAISESDETNNEFCVRVLTDESTEGC